MVKQAKHFHHEKMEWEKVKVMREHQVSSPELCSVCGIAVDGGADGEVCHFTGGLTGHAGVWTSGEAAGREGCRKERARSDPTASGTFI